MLHNPSSAAPRNPEMTNGFFVLVVLGQLASSPSRAAPSSDALTAAAAASPRPPDCVRGAAAGREALAASPHAGARRYCDALARGYSRLRRKPELSLEAALAQTRRSAGVRTECARGPSAGHARRASQGSLARASTRSDPLQASARSSGPRSTIWRLRPSSAAGTSKRVRRIGRSWARAFCSNRACAASASTRGGHAVMGVGPTDSTKR